MELQERRWPDPAERREVWFLQLCFSAFKSHEAAGHDSSDQEGTRKGSSPLKLQLLIILAERRVGFPLPSTFGQSPPLPLIWRVSDDRWAEESLISGSSIWTVVISTEEPEEILSENWPRDPGSSRDESRSLDFTSTLWKNKISNSNSYKNTLIWAHRDFKDLFVKSHFKIENKDHTLKVLELLQFILKV